MSTEIATTPVLPARTSEQLEMVLFVTGYRHFMTLAPPPEGAMLGAQRAAEERWTLRENETFGHGWRHTRDLRPVLLYPADSVRIGFEGFDAAPAFGWVTGRVRLSINCWDMGEQPMTFYAGAATDWPTGLASWHQAYNFDDSPLPPPIWQLALRRSR